MMGVGVGGGGMIPQTSTVFLQNVLLKDTDQTLKLRED